ncbi:MAG TPA: YceI family protein, partial [Chloroflexota bacterium]|nr:YceI family protein [Chloroflexota bacterium]
AAALIVACGGQQAALAPAGSAPSTPAACPAVTPLVLPTPAPGTGPGGPGGPPPGAGPGGPGGPGGPPPSGQQAGAAATVAPEPTLAPVPAGALRFQVAGNRSTATFRVREQLAGVSLPNDAVGCTGSVAGQLVVQPTGAFVSGASRITVDLRDLKSDSDQRDNFIKSSVLQVQRYPQASFVPTRAEGLPNPIPASGSATFTLTGPMTVHGVTRDQTWQVTARREGNNLTGTATTSFAFGDYGMQPPRVPVVLSVVDEIRLEVALVGAQAT